MNPDPTVTGTSEHDSPGPFANRRPGIGTYWSVCHVGPVHESSPTRLHVLYQQTLPDRLRSFTSCRALKDEVRKAAPPFFCGKVPLSYESFREGNGRPILEYTSTIRVPHESALNQVWSTYP